MVFSKNNLGFLEILIFCHFISPQSSNFEYFSDFSQIWKSGHRPPILELKKNISRSVRLAIRFQRALNDFPIFIQTEIRAILVFCDRNAQIWKFGPRLQIFREKIYFDFTQFCLPIRFQRALNDFHKLIFDHFMNLFQFLPFWAHCSLICQDFFHCYFVTIFCNCCCSVSEYLTWTVWR